jgi:hypothetical protein
MNEQLKDDPVAREKLLRARAEVNAILAKYDIAGFVVMHAAPNASEVICHLEPSYSVVKILKGQAVIRSKLEDYNGDKEAQRRDLTASVNMASSLFELTAHTAMMLGNLSKTLDKLTHAGHTEMTQIKHN